METNSATTTSPEGAGSTGGDLAQAKAESAEHRKFMMEMASITRDDKKTEALANVINRQSTAMGQAGR